MSSKHRITASQLYSYIQCPHRVWRDLYGPQEEKIKETNPFVQLLWDRGVQHEEKVVKRLGGFTDLGEGSLAERIEATKVAMDRKISLLYQPVITSGNLLGIPDFLRLLDDGSYQAMDVKSGRGFEGTTDAEEEDQPKLKKHYAVQLALYTEILEQLGYSNGLREGTIYDIDHQEILYQLDSPMGKRNQQSFWHFYLQIKTQVERLLGNTEQNDPAMAGVCKLCPWYNSCKKWTKQVDDPTQLFYVGRSLRDTLRADLNLRTVQDAQHIMIDQLMQEKRVQGSEFLHGVGESTLIKLKKRAILLTTQGSPVLYHELDLPKVTNELFFDIEDDPTQGFVYLHGVYERTPKGERFVPFVAKEFSEESEREAWQEFWDYIRSFDENDFAIYYYSHHEKTTYKKMAEQYPEVASLEDVEWLYEKSRAIDLYMDVILKHTDWPVGSYSLKTITQYLGFKWRDATPSGALSIEWYNKYLESQDEKILERILLYNEDDCIATMIIKDALDKMSPAN